MRKSFPSGGVSSSLSQRWHDRVSGQRQDIPFGKEACRRSPTHGAKRVGDPADVAGEGRFVRNVPPSAAFPTFSYGAA